MRKFNNITDVNAPLTIPPKPLQMPPKKEKMEDQQHSHSHWQTTVHSTTTQ